MAVTGRTTRAGLVVGLIAYASVAVFYSIFDFLAARGAFYTVNLLGRSMFRGLRDAGVLQLPVRLDTTAILLYNGVHLVLSLAIGLIVMWLIDRAERYPSQARLMLAVIVVGFVVTILAVGWVSAPIRPVLPWWSIVVANTFAVMLVAIYLLWTHPGIGQRITRTAH